MKPFIVTLNVTRKDMVKGDPSDIHDCPILRLAKKAVGRCVQGLEVIDIWAGFESVGLALDGGPLNTKRMDAAMPKIGSNFQQFMCSRLDFKDSCKRSKVRPPKLPLPKPFKLRLLFK